MGHSKFTARTLEYISFFIIFVVGFPMSTFVCHNTLGSVFQPGEPKTQLTWFLLMSLWFLVTTVDMESGYICIRTLHQKILRLFRLNCIALLAFLTIAEFVNLVPDSTFLGIVYAVIVSGLMVGSARLTWWASRYRQPAERKLFVMSDLDGTSLQRLAAESEFHRDNIVGIVANNDALWTATSVSVLGNLEHLPQVLKRYAVDTVVFVSHLPHPAINSVIRICNESGMNLELVFIPKTDTVSTLRVIQAGRQPILRIESVLDDPLGLCLKRITDVVISLFALVILSPMLGAIAIGIRLTSAGPVLFRQERVGLRGRRFTCYKFRSMVVDAEARKNELLHLNEMSGPVFKIRNDPRVTRFGAWLRRTSFDELPQLLNVLLGHMSLVGPRPPLPSEVERYDPWQRRRLSVRPGITGLWQISGRTDVDFEQWMRMDLEYIDHWSFSRDLFILLKTIPVVLSKRGAY